MASIPTVDEHAERIRHLRARLKELDEILGAIKAKTYRRLWFYLAYFGGVGMAYFFAAGIFFAVQDYFIFWTYLTVGLVFMACGTSTLWISLKILVKK